MPGAPGPPDVLIVAARAIANRGQARGYIHSAMCGIGGILRTDGQPIPEEWLDAIDARIAWRGPDGCGRFRDRVEIDDPDSPDGKRIVEVAFVHRRLSIIDHEGGHQPMVSERGRNDGEGLVAVVFNGCIYNHRELRRELEAKGHTFVTDHSDTEVLIHGWREWGPNLHRHLRGMYAFALWDRGAARLAVAQDWFAQKPLFLRRLPESGEEPTKPPHVVIFGSDIQAVTSAVFPLYPLDADTATPWAAMYLRRGYVDSYSWPYCFGDLAQSLGGGNALVIETRDLPSINDAPQLNDFWGGQAPHPSTLESVLDAAVASHLEADVTLGCFLSGGVDSSLISLFAKRHRSELKTFCVRMPDPRFDESEFASAIAAHIGTRHTTLQASAQPAADCEALIRRFGLPFGDSSILPTYWVCRAARREVKVALSGDGGDELFFGYERYMAAPLLRWMWRLLRPLPAKRFLESDVKTRRHKIGRFIEMARDYPWIQLAAMESIFTLGEVADLTGWLPAWDAGCPPEWGAMLSLRYYDMCNYLGFDLLRKVDVASMCVGLEVRCPLLDLEVASTACGVYLREAIPWGQRKGLLRRIARKYLPKEIVDRPKMGFAIPIGEWFRDDNLPSPGGGMKTLLLDHLESAEPFGPIQLNRKAVRRFIDEHMSGKRDHGQRLFTLLTLSIWARGIGKA